MNLWLTKLHAAKLIMEKCTILIYFILLCETSKTYKKIRRKLIFYEI